MGRGKHFIGDFLPPDELEKFMETFKALKVKQQRVGRGWQCLRLIPQQGRRGRISRAALALAKQLAALQP